MLKLTRLSPTFGMSSALFRRGASLTWTASVRGWRAARATSTTTATTRQSSSSSESDAPEKHQIRSPTAQLVPPYPKSKTASPVSFFGSQEPILVDEENYYLKEDITGKQDDFITYDAEAHRCDTEEDEKKRFSDFLDVYGEAVADQPVFRGKERDFVVSRDPEEWRHVENLIPGDLVPNVPEKAEYPSGFVPATAKPGDHPYFVHRTNVSSIILFLTCICRLHKNITAGFLSSLDDAFLPAAIMSCFLPAAKPYIGYRTPFLLGRTLFFTPEALDFR